LNECRPVYNVSFGQVPQIPILPYAVAKENIKKKNMSEILPGRKFFSRTAPCAKKVQDPLEDTAPLLFLLYHSFPKRETGFLSCVYILARAVACQ
jgi:hypothetical protein